MPRRPFVLAVLDSALRVQASARASAMTRRPTGPRSVLSLACAAALGLALAGCNTMEGLGQDIQGAGRALETAADGEDSDK